MRLKERLAENQQRGVEFLDRNIPDWREQIDLETLELSDGQNCIAGQLGGSYCSFVISWGIMGEDYGMKNLGDHFSSYSDYGYLEKLWRNEVVQERELATA